MARPMPRPPPVTIATRPERLIRTVPFVNAKVRAATGAFQMPRLIRRAPSPPGKRPAAIVSPLFKVGQRRDEHLFYERSLGDLIRLRPMQDHRGWSAGSRQAGQSEAKGMRRS